MQRLTELLLVFFSGTLSCSAADVLAWGKAVNGLRISISLSERRREGGQDITASIQNLTASGARVALGIRTGTEDLPLNFELKATTPDGMDRPVFLTQSVGIGGYVENRNWRLR
jgi:hypothetical protein